MTTKEKIDFFLDLENVDVDYVLRESVELDPSGVSVDVSEAAVNEDFTVFILYEKTNSEASTLWSAYSDNPETGYLIGVTASNKLFVTVFDETERSTFTSDVVLSSKNGISISHIEGFLAIEAFDFNSERFLRRSFNFNDANVNINQNGWMLGHDQNLTLGLTPLEGEMDYFVYFGTYLNWGIRREIFKVFYNNLILGADGELINVTGTSEGSFVIVPTSEEATYEYNLIGTSDDEVRDVYGWVETTETVTENEPYWNKAGTLESICVYYENQDIYVIEFAPTTDTRVTGVELQVVGTETTAGKPIYEKIIIEESVDEYEVVDDTDTVEQQFEEDGFLLIPRTSYKQEFGMDWMTYTSLRHPGTEDWTRIVIYPNAVNLLDLNININANTTGDFRLLGRFEESLVRLFLQGQLLSRDEYDVIKRKALSENFKFQDTTVYDIIANSFTETPIAQQSDFDNITGDNSLHYFFNGQLLEEGTDYTILYDDFVPSAELETETGMIISVTFDLVISYATSDGLFYATNNEDVYSFSVSAVVENGYDYRGVDKFPRNTGKIYLNGIRLTNANYIEHGNIDLIPGNHIEISNRDAIVSVNNDEESFWQS